MSTPGRPQPLAVALFAGLPIVLTVAEISIFRSVGSFAGDFHKEFWPAGWRVLHGASPYVTAPAQVANGEAFPYPALSALLFAPFALLPRAGAEVVFTALLLAALVATLRVLGVRDWRVPGVALLWAPVVNAWQSANLTLLLALGIALMWRYRDRPAVAGLCAAAVISLKPFVWPVALWLLATRRFAAAAWCAATGLVVNALAFLVIGGPTEVGRYLDDARKVTPVFSGHAYTPFALAERLGASPSAAVVAAAAVCLGLAALCVAAGRRGGDLRSLTVAVGLMVAASPVLWLHYLALALIPLAIARPRLRPVWALPLLLFAVPSRSTSAAGIVLALAVTAVVLAAGSVTGEGLRRVLVRRPQPIAGV